MEEVCLCLCKEVKENYHEHGKVEESNLITKIISGQILIEIIEKLKNAGVGTGWVERRKRLAKLDIGRAYISFIGSDPCHVQWVFDSSDNEKLALYYKGEYPALHAGEAILEHALTLPAYRRKGIHQKSRHQIIEIERENFKIRRFLSFINPNNIPSIKVAINQGFVPTMIRKEKWFLFKKKFVFEEYKEDLLHY